MEMEGGWRWREGERVKMEGGWRWSELVEEG